MKDVFQPLIAILFSALVLSADHAIGAGIARDIIRAIFYGLAALFCLVAFLLVVVVH